VIAMGALQRPKGAADKAMAYREAGRIAAAFELGICIRPRGISIVRSDEYRGRAHLILQLENLDSVILTDEMRLEAEKHAIMSLSGVEAQKKYRPSSVRSRLASNDYDDAVGIMAYFFPQTHELDAYVWFLTRRAKNMMAAPQVWERVETLATALMERHTLSVEEAEQLMWEATVAFTSDRATSGDS
jgi:hypothetical protein